MATKRYLNVEATQGGSQYIAGVPLTDLSDEQYESLPEWQQKQVDNSGLYRKSAPPSTEKKAATTDKDKKEQEG